MLIVRNYTFFVYPAYTDVVLIGGKEVPQRPSADFHVFFRHLAILLYSIYNFSASIWRIEIVSDVWVLLNFEHLGIIYIAQYEWYIR